MATSNPLGEFSKFPERYDPGVLFRIPRSNRDCLPFASGFDRWVSYEVSCLSIGGSPWISILEVLVPAHSKYLFESKSFKLYLGGFASERISHSDFTNRVRGDLQKLIEETGLTVRLYSMQEAHKHSLVEPNAECIDVIVQNLEKQEYRGSSPLIFETQQTQEKLYTNCFRSLCPVTSQPDYATVLIEYSGPRINKYSLQKYLASYRYHNGYHEDCCEKIFADLSQAAKLNDLTVACYFTRRGGIEINPIRSSKNQSFENYFFRTPRQ